MNLLTPVKHQLGRIQVTDEFDSHPKARPLVNRLACGIADIVQRGGPHPVSYAALSEWFSTVGKARSDGLLDEADMQELRAAFGPALGPATIQGRSFLKKAADAANFEIIDEIYRCVISSDPALKGWDEFFHAQAVPKAIRNRKTYFTKLVAQTLAVSPQGIEVLHVATGCSRDMADFFETNPSANVRFTCIDADARAIAYAETVCAPWLGRVTLICSDALSLQFDHKFDLIWSASLGDDADDCGFVTHLQNLRGMAKPGGAGLVVAGFLNPNPSASYLEMAGWFLCQRTQTKLIDLALEAGVAASDINLERETEGVNLFLQIAPE